jgi:four helix bundle protein
MAFDTYDVALASTRALRETLERIRLADPNLCDQLRRAASSMLLNISEGRWKAGRDRANRYRIAAGSAAETRACLQLAEAWAFVSPEMIEEPVQLLDRVLAMLWVILNPKPKGPSFIATDETCRWPEDDESNIDPLSEGEQSLPLGHIEK